MSHGVPVYLLPCAGTGSRLYCVVKWQVCVNNLTKVALECGLAVD